MSKRVILFFICFLSLISLSLSASAETDDFAVSSGAGALYDGLSSETQGLLEDFGITGVDGTDMFETSFSSILSAFKSVFSENIRQPALFFFKLLGVLVLITAVKSVADYNSDILDLFSTLMCAVLTAQAVSGCISAVLSASEVCSKFLLAYVPVFAVIVSVSGSAATALTYNTAVLGAAEIISAASSRLVMPACGMFMSIGTAFSINSAFNAQRVSAAMNRIITLIIGVCSTLFAGLLSIRGVLSSGVDTLASRGIRMAISSFIPVVGGAISEAYSSLMGSLGLIKGSVAVFGVATVFVMNLPVLLQAVLYTLSLNLVAFISDAFSQGGMSGVFRCMSCTLKLMSVVLVLQIFLIVISTGIILLMKGSA